MYPYNIPNDVRSAARFPVVTVETGGEAIIRNSNTIFSTMVCPKCGKRLVFYVYTTDEFMACCPNDDYKLNITIKGLIMLLNNNGLNWLVTPPNPTKALEETKESVPPPPDGFKVEPPEDD